MSSGAVIAASFTCGLGPMKSGHEAYAVILEELDEFWYEIKHGSKTKARDEAIQVAAMAVRFLMDV
jgi:hypothetical protein